MEIGIWDVFKLSVKEEQALRQKWSINSQSNTFYKHSQKKGTKAVTGAVPFKLLSISGANMYILGANMNNWGANMYILGVNMYI